MALLVVVAIVGIIFFAKRSFQANSVQYTDTISPHIQSQSAAVQTDVGLTPTLEVVAPERPQQVAISPIKAGSQTKPKIRQTCKTKGAYPRPCCACGIEFRWCGPGC